MKKRNLLIMIVLCFALSLFAKAEIAQAANKNTAAHSAYQKIMSNICATEFPDDSINREIEYEYLDLTGNGVHEALMQYHTYKGGSACDVRIYNYQKGKAKCILSDYIYGMEKLTYYPKVDGLVIYSAGHGHEIYRYYKISKGKYQFKGSKGRSAEAGGGVDGPWYYSSSNGKSISASSFKKITKSVQKGSKKTYKLNYSTIKRYPQ